MDLSIVHDALTKRFDRRRIVFWVDEEGKLRETFDAVDLPDVIKAEWSGPGFGLKYQMMREQPDDLFLVYREGPAPADEDNWMLDTILANDQFSADQTALWMADIGISGADRPHVQEHAAFFAAESRREELKSRLERMKASGEDLRKHLLAICAGVAEPRTDSVLERLLQDVANGRDERYNLIERVGLTDYLWTETRQHYGYKSDAPSPTDFALQVFKDRLAYDLGEEDSVQLLPEIRLFFDRWRKEPRYTAAFMKLSDRFADDLDIETRLSSLLPDALKRIEIYRLVDEYILQRMTADIAAQRMSATRAQSYRDTRRYSPWYAQAFRPAYDALCYASEFLALTDTAQINPHSFDDGITRYSKEWWKIDSAYRKFMVNAGAPFQSLFSDLKATIEARYETGFLSPLNDSWQAHINACNKWGGGTHLYQRNFFDKKVKPTLSTARTAVIISDALRYEVGEELARKLRGIDRYDVDIEPAVSVLPSYTQLGMAALLPHKSLEITQNSSAHVEADEIRAAGLAGRQKVLSAASDTYGAILAKDFMELDRDGARDFMKAHECVYIYHNVIDRIGDKRDSEHELFDACETAIKELEDLVKKVANSNVTYMCVTADHGFIYQNRKVHESDYISQNPKGEELFYTDRRYVLGQGLEDNAGLRTFTSNELGLGGDMQIQIPKSISRMRKQGSGSRFVHGGAALQEIIIPVISIYKGRRSDTGLVDVDIMAGHSSITSAQHTFRLYQTEAVTDKRAGRTLKAGLYGEDGVLLSNEEELIFDSASSAAAERETRLALSLNMTADKYSGQTVHFKLKARIAGTRGFKDYKQVGFQLKRYMGTDF